METFSENYKIYEIIRKEKKYTIMSPSAGPIKINYNLPNLIEVNNPRGSFKYILDSLEKLDEPYFLKGLSSKEIIKGFMTFLISPLDESQFLTSHGIIFKADFKNPQNDSTVQTLIYLSFIVNFMEEDIFNKNRRLDNLNKGINALEGKLKDLKLLF